MELNQNTDKFRPDNKTPVWFWLAIAAGIAVWAIGLLLTSTDVGLFFAARQEPSFDLRKPDDILKPGRLAELPKTATDIKAERWSAFFYSSEFLMFKASPADINDWLGKSESIKDVRPVIFTPEHQYTAHIDQNDLKDEKYEQYYKDKYFSPAKDWPGWYKPSIEARGRVFEIPGATNCPMGGSVIVNDETSTVYITICW